MCSAVSAECKYTLDTGNASLKVIALFKSLYYTILALMHVDMEHSMQIHGSIAYLSHSHAIAETV